MFLNKEQVELSKRINNNLLFKLFSITKLPLAFITGLKILKFNENECVTTVRLKYLNKNPFQSTYFAVLSMAAELSTGAYGLLAASGQKPSVALVITSMKADFLKKAKGRTNFTCTEGKKLLAAVERTVRSQEPQVETISTIGRNENGETIAIFEFTWSFKQRK